MLLLINLHCCVVIIWLLLFCLGKFNIRRLVAMVCSLAVSVQCRAIRSPDFILILITEPDIECNIGSEA